MATVFSFSQCSFFSFLKSQFISYLVPLFQQKANIAALFFKSRGSDGAAQQKIEAGKGIAAGGRLAVGGCSVSSKKTGRRVGCRRIYITQTVGVLVCDAQL